MIKIPIWIDSEKGAIISSKSGATISCNFIGSCRISRIELISDSSSGCVLLKNGCLTLLKCKISKNSNLIHF